MASNLRHTLLKSYGWNPEILGARDPQCFMYIKNKYIYIYIHIYIHIPQKVATWFSGIFEVYDA